MKSTLRMSHFEAVSLTLILLVLVVFITSFFLTTSAAAQPSACTDRKYVLDHLSTQYKEVPIAMGITNDGSVLEILSSKAGKSWTIILTMPNGMSCMIAAGENWESLPYMTQLGPAT